MTLSRLHESPFDSADVWARDAFNRREFSKRLVELIKASPNGSVIALDGEYGTGKSFFLSRLAHELESSENKLTTVYIDTWKDDFISEPVDLIVEAIHQRLTNGGQSAGNKKTGADLLKAVAPIAAKIATKAVFKMSDEDWGEAVKALGEGAAELSEKFVQKRIEQVRVARKSIEASKRALRNLVQKQENKSLVLVIDELDRCKPDYALQYLEIIKHIFSEPGVFFFVAADFRTLRSIIKVKFGNEIDADGYLRRFFDHILGFPESSTESFVRNLSREHYFVEDKLLSTKDEAFIGISYFEKLLIAVADHQKVPLRSIQRAYQLANLVLRLKGRYPPLAIFLGFLIGTYAAGDEKYRQARTTLTSVNTSNRADEVRNFLRGQMGMRESAKYESWFLAACVDPYGKETGSMGQLFRIPEKDTQMFYRLINHFETLSLSKKPIEWLLDLVEIGRTLIIAR